MGMIWGSPLGHAEEPTFSEEESPESEQTEPVFQDQLLATITANKYDHVTFSPDGTRVAYVVIRENDQFVVLSDKTNTIQDEIFSEVDPPVFSPDGKHLAYIGHRAIRGKSRGFVSVEGLGQAFEDINAPIFQIRDEETEMDKKLPRQSFLIKAGGKLPRQSFLVVAAQDDALDPELVIWRIFTPAGTKIAYEASRGKQGPEKKFISLEHPPQVDEKTSLLGPPVFSPDGKQIAVRATNLRKTNAAESTTQLMLMVSTDGRQFSRGTEYAEVGRASFSPAGDKLAHSIVKYHDGTRSNRTHVVIDDTTSEPVDQIYTDLIFSPTGDDLGFGARIGNELWWKTVNARAREEELEKLQLLLGR